MNQDQNIGPGLKHDSTVRANTNEKKEKSTNKITLPHEYQNEIFRLKQWTIH